MFSFQVWLWFVLVWFFFFSGEVQWVNYRYVPYATSVGEGTCKLGNSDLQTRDAGECCLFGQLRVFLICPYCYSINIEDISRIFLPRLKYTLQKSAIPNHQALDWYQSIGHWYQASQSDLTFNFFNLSSVWKKFYSENQVQYRYGVKKSFSEMVVTKTKLWRRLHINNTLRVTLSPITPRWDGLI